MYTFTRITVLVILSVSCTCGQDEDLLGLPEFDIFEMEADAFYQQRKPDYSNSVSDYLKSLCDQYDLHLDEEKIDCQRIRITPKSVQSEKHSLQKREAVDDTPLEGSGEPESETNSDTTQGEFQKEQPAEETKFEPAVPYKETIISEQESGTQSSNIIGTSDVTEPIASSADVVGPYPESPSENKENPTDKGTNVEEAVPNDKEQTDSNDQEPSAPEETRPEADGTPTETPNQESPAENQGGQEGANIEPVVPYGKEKSSDNSQATNEEETSNNEKPSSQANDVTSSVPIVPYDHNQENIAITEDLESPAQTANPVEGEEAASTIVKKGRILSSGVATENKKVEMKNDGDGNEAEKLHEQQSGNALIDAPGSDTLEGSEVAVRKMATKENLQEPSNTDLPKSGESSETTQEARKDSKVLIILLVAVVVIGCAAFAYNFIKKRKQKKSEETRAENGSSTVKRAPGEKDTEQGTELKPLMRTPVEKPVVEYKDEKNAQAIEAK